jgi:chromosome segregation ATPase
VLVGKYTEAERQRIREVAEHIANGRKHFAEAVDELARELDRSTQGVRLLLGRTVRVLNGTTTRRSRTVGGPRRRHSLPWLVETTREKVRELERLRREEGRVRERIEALEAELRPLQEEILRQIGVEVPVPGAASEAAGEEASAAR